MNWIKKDWDYLWSKIELLIIFFLDKNEIKFILLWNIQIFNTHEITWKHSVELLGSGSEIVISSYILLYFFLNFDIQKLFTVQSYWTYHFSTIGVVSTWMRKPFIDEFNEKKRLSLSLIWNRIVNNFFLSIIQRNLFHFNMKSIWIMFVKFLESIVWTLVQ